MSLRLTSSAFLDGADMPRRCTRFGEDVSPPLSWSGTPRGTESFALLVEDPDAPEKAWLHWLLFDIPATCTGLGQDLPRAQNLADGMKQGWNDYGHLGYGGPCPPPGPAHRYVFQLFAVDRLLRVSPRGGRRALRSALAGHVLGEAQLVGRFARPPGQ
jgi:Raf kinase inhibitor-like YbhB/YbcL family protein